MKTEITAKDYIDIYEACDWNPILFSKALKSMRYSDELIVDGDLNLRGSPIKSLISVKNVRGSLDLYGTPIQDLGNLQKVGGYLDLEETPIQSLGNLEYVGGWLDLRNTPIQDIGNPKEVGGDLDLRETPLAKKYSEEEIRQIVKVNRYIYL